MDGIAPPLNALLHIQLHIKNGLSVRSAIKQYIQDHAHCFFAKQMSLWIFCIETGKKFQDADLSKKFYRKTFLEILNQGVKGEPILNRLNEFEEELKSVCFADIEHQIQKLPFISLIPLFLFQVPAFFLLLLAPLLLELQQSF